MIRSGFDRFLPVLWSVTRSTSSSPLLDEIDRAAEHESAVDEDRIGQAARIASLVAQAKAELEVLGAPRVIVGQLLHPDAEVAPQLVHLVAPHPLDRRRELLGVVGGDAIEHGVERLRRRRERRASPAARRPPASRDRTPPAPCETGCRASADPDAPAAAALRAARGDRSWPAGTDTGTWQTAGAPTANTAGWPAAGDRWPPWPVPP